MEAFRKSFGLTPKAWNDLTGEAELWPTCVNTFASTPISALRAIILDALVEAAHEDERVALAAAASARNILSFLETGNESAILVEIVNEIEASVYNRAEREWPTPSNMEIGQLLPESVANIKIGNSAITVNRDVLRQKFQTAAQANNTYFQHNPTGWANNFSSLFADAFADIFDEISAKAKVGAVDLSTPLQQVTSKVRWKQEGALLSRVAVRSRLRLRRDVICSRVLPGSAAMSD